VRANHFAKGLSLSLFAFFCTALPARSEIVKVSRYINRGNLITVKETVIPCLAFDSTPIFQPNSAPIRLRVSDTLELTVLNLDTAVHSIKLGEWTSPTILPGVSVTGLYYSKTEKVDLFYDPSPNAAYLGLAGIVEVSDANSQTYQWNIRAHQRSLSEALVKGEPVDPKLYYPDYFTINGLSFPDLQTDPESKVIANVGDTVLLFIANTGKSEHSLHFHGFHCKVRYSSSTRIRKGWIKDTFPIGALESLVLELVPDKAGRYSVHDHNLVAITAGGTHPNGMFTIMEITE
jgi:hypothetical protein